MRMFRSVTIGQHIPGDSIIHRLDPRTKILSAIFLIVLLFLVNGFVGYGLVALGIALVIRASRIPWKFVIRGVRPLLVILVLTLTLHLFMTEGRVSDLVLEGNMGRALSRVNDGNEVDFADYWNLHVDFDNIAHAAHRWN